MKKGDFMKETLGKVGTVVKKVALVGWKVIKAVALWLFHAVEFTFLTLLTPWKELDEKGQILKSIFYIIGGLILAFFLFWLVAWIMGFIIFVICLRIFFPPDIVVVERRWWRWW